MKKTLIIAAVILAAFVIGFSFRKVLAPTISLNSPKKTAPTSDNNNPVACTEEAKLCPDGSAVGRSGPNCEFAPCPEINSEPVTSATTTLKIYFGNTDFNPNGIECGKVYPLERVIIETPGVAQAALRELFKGPTFDEKEMGYSSFFSDKTKDLLKSIKIEMGIAYVNLNDPRLIIPNASASCGSANFLGEMQTTLKQFSSIKTIIFAIDGKPATFYDWLQIGCPKDSKPGNICDETPFK